MSDLNDEQLAALREIDDRIDRHYKEGARKSYSMIELAEDGHSWPTLRALVDAGYVEARDSHRPMRISALGRRTLDAIPRAIREDGDGA